MNRIWIAVGLAAIFVWAYSPPGALAQCCGGGSHGKPPKGEKEKPEGQEPDTATPKDVKLPTCPVTDQPVDFSIKTMTKDGPVYFSSKECVKKFDDHPKAYADKIAEQRAALAKLERIQVACPVTGDPIDGKNFISVDGQQIDFCSKDCSAKYSAKPEKYKASLEGSYTYQTRCPVMNGKITPTVFTDLPSGQRIYLCCKGCDGKVQEDPAKYAAALARQGINIDAAKTKDAKSKSGEKDQGKAKSEKKDPDQGKHEHGGGRP
mgnify:CR=1 FL=1